jgi:phosphate-selective porin OprO/OprP
MPSRFGRVLGRHRYASFLLRTSALAAILGSLVASTALAQGAPHPAAPPAQPVAGWQNGFFVQSADGDNRVSIGAVIQVDGRFSTDAPAPFVDTFTIRKARVGLQGRVARYFDFRVTPEFGGGSPTLIDAYIDTRFSSAVRVRVGKDKTPVGLEQLHSGPGLYFNERSLVRGLVPSRDVGVQVQGDVAGARMTYAIGVFNGVADGASSTTEVDVNNGKDVAGRIQVRPFHRATVTPSAFDNFGLHLGASSGSQTGALPSFKTSAGQRYFSYAADATASGDRVRVSPGIFYYYRSFGAFAEYARSDQDVERNGLRRAIANSGWDVSGAIILTGETASSGTIRPNRVFDPAAGQWGAVEIVARYAALTIDKAAFDAGFAANASSREARQTSIGVNWYPVSFLKYYLSYERTAFDEGTAPRPTEHTILFRAQLVF